MNNDNTDTPSRSEMIIKKNGLREAWNYLSEAEWRNEAKKAELKYFFDNNRFCSKCGQELEKNSDISLKCNACGTEIFPHLSPAILVLIKRGEEALLVHARNFRNTDMHALVAGFVETGETLEECVAREVLEETSISIRNIRYFNSQSWPFPSQLMIAFTAEYDSGNICLADNELSSAHWFTRTSLPVLPTMPSLSRVLIDAWIRGEV